MTSRRVWLVVLFMAISAVAWDARMARAAEEPMIGKKLTDAQVEKFARLALDGIVREYPNKPCNVMEGKESVQSPREMHPVFYGSFDWHSSLHGHWMLVRLLKLYPDAPVADEIRAVLDAQLTAAGLQAEAAYFKQKQNASFERMYGWAWVFRFAIELRTFDDSMGKKWAANFAPLEQVIVGHARQYLPKLEWPIRCGFHPESAFPLGQLLDYARLIADTELETLVVEKATSFYGKDVNYPALYEPSGNDFFSQGLNEADLMRRVLVGAEYDRWLTGFFPDLAEGKCGNLLTPAKVGDIDDGHLVHLAGLNLTRAWTMHSIAASLKRDDDERRTVLATGAEAHAKAGLDYVFSGSYEGEHWLASFAIYLLSEVGFPEPV